MLKKLLYFSIILIIAILFTNISYATEIVSNASNTTDTMDNTIYSVTENIDSNEETSSDYEDVATTTTTDYEDEAALSISNMINIILIVVGIVLILLGIAIIIKLK